jgi:hypothetical protein
VLRGAPGARGQLLSLVVTILVALAASPTPASAAGPAPDISGVFIDGWTPAYGPPARPVTIGSGLMTEASPNTVVVEGTATGSVPGFWSVVVSNVAFPLAVGKMPFAQISGPTVSCSQRSVGWGDVTELEWAQDGTLARFAASVWADCGGIGPHPTHAEVRYHATTGFMAYDISPMPLASLPNDPTPTLDFGRVEAGAVSPSRTLTISNPGTEPFAVDVDVAVPLTAAFAIDATACQGATLAGGSSCAIVVSFTPQVVGAVTATVSLSLPDFPAATRTALFTGIGTGAATTRLWAIGGHPEEWDLDGTYWLGFQVFPGTAEGGVTITVTCGDLVKYGFGGWSPEAVPPGLKWFELPPGPCTASAGFDGTNGWSGTGAGPIDFVVPSFSTVWLEVQTADGPNLQRPIRGGLSAHVTVHVAGTNGATPTGGTVTIVDLLTGDRVGSGAIDPGTLTFSADTAPLGGGPHVLRATYSGDDLVAGSKRDWPLPVDADGPLGTVSMLDGVVATNVPEAPLVLAASDAMTDVDLVRVSDAPTTGADGQLLTGETFPPTTGVFWPLKGADGPKHAYVQWRDTVGNWSTPLEATIILDRVAPVTRSLSAHVSPAGASVDGATVPIALAWAATEATSGVARYEVRRSTDGRAWSGVTSSLRVAALTARVAPGHTYRFSVRAIDKAGNVGAWTNGATLRVTATQQSASSVRYRRTWRTVSAMGYWGGTARTSTAAGATASVTFTGRSFAWVGVKGPGRGRARVSVDGRVVATVDLKATSTRYERLVWARTWTTSGTHTVTIRVLGTAGRPRVDVDGFVWTR